MDAGLAPKSGILGPRALPESILDSPRGWWQWLDQAQPSPLHKPLSRQLRWTAPGREKFDIGSRDNLSQVRRRKSPVPLLRIALEECGFERQPRKPLEPAAWRHTRRQPPGEPDPGIAGGAADSGGPAIRREQHLPERPDSAMVDSTGGPQRKLENYS